MYLLGKYRNGNYITSIYSDGTKIRETEDNEFTADFPENIDIKITNQCDMGCPMCHEDSKPDGKHGDIMNAKFIDTLRPYTELAIGGGNPLSHPDLVPFLNKLKDRHIIANLTVNQKHFMENKEFLMTLKQRKLIYGLGVSLNYVTDEFINTIKLFDNAVIHIINGIVQMGQLEELADNDLKILILGYKDFHRGKEYKNEHHAYIDIHQVNLKCKLKYYISRFKVVSFDNLAIEQLDVKSLMTEEQWNEFYMGDDSNFTMYIDMVEETFAKNSVTALERRYKLLDNIDEMFAFVKGEQL